MMELFVEVAMTISLLALSFVCIVFGMFVYEMTREEMDDE